MYSNPKHYSYLPFRKGVGAVIINDKREILVGSRVDLHGDAWQMPQGGIDIENKESEKDAILREVEEETSITRVNLLLGTKELYFYDLPYHSIDKFWNGKYRGQEQRWFLLHFVGDESEININTEVQEFSKWKWIPKEQLLNVVVNFKKPMYAAIFDEFRILL